MTADQQNEPAALLSALAALAPLYGARAAPSLRRCLVELLIESGQPSAEQPPTQAKAPARPDRGHGLCAWETMLPGGRVVACTEPVAPGRPLCAHHGRLFRLGKALRGRTLLIPPGQRTGAFQIAG